MGRKKSMTKLVTDQMLGILKNGRVTEQVTGKGDAAVKTVTKRPPSTADMKLALEMARHADTSGDHKTANALRDGVRARQSKTKADVLGTLPPVGEADDAATRSA